MNQFQSEISRRSFLGAAATGIASAGLTFGNDQPIAVGGMPETTAKRKPRIVAINSSTG
ncbi:MAG: twin-arginine translocation signal domain-containing protein [Schlesneria sp.]